MVIDPNPEGRTTKLPALAVEALELSILTGPPDTQPIGPIPDDAAAHTGQPEPTLRAFLRWVAAGALLAGDEMAALYGTVRPRRH